MITVKELAVQLNISKTAIYNMLKRKDIPTFKKDGITYLDDTAEALIRAHYATERQETIQDILNVEPDVESVNAGLIRILEEQLKENNATIQGLIQLLNNEQRLRGTQFLVDTQLDKPVKRTLFDRIFKRM